MVLLTRSIWSLVWPLGYNCASPRMFLPPCWTLCSSPQPERYTMQSQVSHLLSNLPGLLCQSVPNHGISSPSFLLPAHKAPSTFNSLSFLPWQASTGLRSLTMPRHWSGSSTCSLYSNLRFSAEESHPVKSTTSSPTRFQPLTWLGFLGHRNHLICRHTYCQSCYSKRAELLSYPQIPESATLPGTK